jgi:hypothetical protein
MSLSVDTLFGAIPDGKPVPTFLELLGAPGLADMADKEKAASTGGLWMVSQMRSLSAN